MRRFFAPKRQFDGGRITLGPDETRHLRDVLRLREGEIVKVFDGEGSEYRAEIVKISKSGSELRAIEQCPPAAPESGLDLTLATAILKGEKFDLVVQKAVELGVKRLVPLFTARSDVKPKGTSKRTERWSRIALEAAKQSGRAALMGIDPPVSFDDFVRSSGKTTCLMFSEREGENFPSYPNLKEITALVGPEGGWEDSEIESARNAGFGIVTLGGRILRAETAAISIAAILQHRFGDLN